jgi:MFS transporter, DHA1 family, multidrug resistance protein
MPYYFLPLLILSLIACCIEVDISAPSFPDMAQYFHVDDGTIQMTIAYNFLGFCLGSILYGPLSDAYGRRPLMIWGNAILALGAIGCVLAPTIPSLLITRFVQGVGAAASAVVVFAMIADAYPSKEKSTQLIGTMNAIFTIIMASAPIAGGFINEVVGWRGNYGIVAIICIISWIFLALLLPETKRSLESFQWGKMTKRYTKLLSSFSFISASLAPSLLYSAYLSFIAQAPFLYTETYHLSLMEYVLHQGAIILAFSAMSLFSGRIISRLGDDKSIVWGSRLSGTGAILMVLINSIYPGSPYLMTATMSLVSIGSAIVYPVIFAGSLEIFPQIKGAASSLIMSMRAFVCFAFVWVTGELYNGNPIRISLIVLSAIAISLFLIYRLLHTKQFSMTAS